MNWFVEVMNWFNDLDLGVKILIGVVLLVAAIIITILTAGSASAAWAAIGSLLVEFAFGVVISVAIYTVTSLINGEFSWGGFAEAFADGVFWGGVFAFVSAGINAAKSAYRSLAQRSKVSAGTGECQTPGQCFIAGTLVLTAAGLKPIEEIEVGDEVLAYDEETGEQAYKPVTRLFRNTTEEWYHVKINGEEIVCTGGHPFYILNAENDRNIVNFEGVRLNGVGKWICARELRASDKVLLSDGSCGIIETVEVETLTAPEMTYNFEVADFHTYYVSDSKVLVHNQCPGKRFTKDQQAVIELAKEAKKRVE